MLEALARAGSRTMENAPAPQLRDALLVPPPAGRARWLASALIALLLLHQLLVPLAWYLGGGGSDERFRWRMFSSLFYQERLRAQSCRAATRERSTAQGALRSVEVRSLLPSMWLPALAAGRRDVVEGFLRWRCERSGATEIHFELACTGPDGAEAEPRELAAIDCASRELRGAEPGW
jgi:hypothetical protein